MEIGSLILRKVVGPFVRRAIPAVRTGRARLTRGRCFSLPAGKTYILIPRALDYESAKQITGMLDRLWYQEPRDWEVVRIGDGEAPLTDDMRHSNLIILGGPDQNPAARELVEHHPELFSSVAYTQESGAPEFRWMDRSFRASQGADFALMAVKRNVLTSNQSRRLVLIFGLSGTGTLAAARLYADRHHQPDRRALQREAGSLRGHLEVLLHVSHSAETGEIRRVRAAKRSDGTPIHAPTHVPSGSYNPLTVLRPSLARIYDSLERHRRPLVFSDVQFILTITSEFSLRIEEEVTVSADSQDIVVFTKAIRGTPLGPDEDITFNTSVVDSHDDQVYLPAEILQNERRFLLFPLPSLVAGGPTRRIRVSAVWPRACLSLEPVGGEDFNSVEVPDSAGPRVDRVTVTIRFEMQDAAFRVIERFSLENAVSVDTPAPSRRRTYGIHAPYQLQLVDVRPGTPLNFRIERVALPDAA